MFIVRSSNRFITLDGQSDTILKRIVKKEMISVGQKWGIYNPLAKLKGVDTIFQVSTPGSSPPDTPL